MKILNWIYMLILSSLIIFSCENKTALKSKETKDGNQENGEQEAYYKRLLADPATGEIPKNMRNRELAYSEKLPVFYGIKRGEDIWKQRGPLNQGGRTRAFGINVDNHKELLAGSASGGIYKSLDEGKTWTRMQCAANSITCLVQDTRQGKTNIWYAGTGELSGSSGSAPNAYYLGQGIYKSIDGGNTWNVLPATDGGSVSSFDTQFDGVWNIVIDLSNTLEDEIYAATYAGIFKTTDGGITWKNKRAASIPKASYYTDVAINSEGVVYATISSESSLKGLWRSTDGETWVKITPAGFPVNYSRICIGIVPSDENQVYFIASGTTNEGFVSTNFQGVKEWNSLWKFDFVSGNGTGSGARWINKSANLPDKGGDFGYYSTQQGYDLYIRIKPNDSNVVFIGATNLWRSRDAFRSNTKTDWIGGYGVNTFRPDFKLYPNHHPDNHNLIFFPNNPERAYSTHDGGISHSSEIMATNVVWDNLNTHYVTSQFYTIAIDHALNSDNKIIGGLQDNGTQFMDVYGAASWQMSFNGDGSYCAFKDGSHELIASAQQGRIAHLEIDAIGNPIKYARIDPDFLNRDNYDFINPFVLDPNDQKIMYLLAKTKLYRNLNIDAKALSTTFDSTRWATTLWDTMKNCTLLTGHEISSIAVSKLNANTIYYGTSLGKLYKVNGANIGQPTPLDISGSNFGTGNINCIALDPLDSNRLTIVFSNYNVISLYTSDDGGKTWNNISGNLEENPNGSGDGPSCRWASVITLANGNKCWFIGTSVGLFATDTLNGLQTRWIRQSPNGIGNTIVSMIDCRQQDYYLAVATHGNGVYSANIAAPWQITSIEDNMNTAKFVVFPNPVTNKQLNIRLQSDLHSVKFTLYNFEGKSFAIPDEKLRSLGRGEFELEIGDLPPGQYILAMEHADGKYSERLIIL